MELAQLQTVLGPYLQGTHDLPTTQQALYGDVAAHYSHGLALYGRFCQQHRLDALSGVYAATRVQVLAHLGADGWQTLVNAYFAQHGMWHVELNHNGAAFAAYLASRADLPAWWNALADLEWWEWCTWRAEDDPADLATHRGPLRLASTVEVRPYAWDVLAWLQQEDANATPVARPHWLLFWRDGDLDACRDYAESADLLLLQQIYQGQPVTDLARLAEFREAGIILGGGDTP